MADMMLVECGDLAQVLSSIMAAFPDTAPTFKPLASIGSDVYAFVDDDRIATHMQTVTGVRRIHRHAPDLPLATRFLKEKTTVSIGGIDVGGGDLFIVAGPCAVESLDDAASMGIAVRALGAHALRGGIFKPRTSPWSFQGLEHDGLKLIPALIERTGLPFITEVTDPRVVEEMAKTATVLQVGARNMQNIPLLKALGKTTAPVLLKRGFGATVDELLASAEYILAGGNDRVLLCERGIRTFAQHTRFTLDVGGIAWLKRHTHLPVLVDPSHAAGRADLVTPLALAGLASGADGLLVEVHQSPAHAMSDGEQALTLDAFAALMNAVRAIAPSLGRTVPGASQTNHRRGRAA